ncbi:MAG: hypothetical protein FWF46_06465 [Oscillospiraceae bacterium]|nr:hypothetical protein [Oscillospiraceae bacterium]
MVQKPLNYCRAIVIVHGKSELLIFNYIKSSLHLTIKSFSKNNGNNSIQITSLTNVLNSNEFLEKKNLSKFGYIESANNKFINFKLFIIMDTDDCTKAQKEAYINKEMFKNHWLYEYIVPIYNINTLEEVVKKVGLVSKEIKSCDKINTYIKIFPPTNKKEVTVDNIEEIKQHADIFRNEQNTNLEELFDYCLECVQAKK